MRESFFFIRKEDSSQYCSNLIVRIIDGDRDYIMVLFGNGKDKIDAKSSEK